MRIIGGHDYYDYGLAFGRDDAVVYVRRKSCPENQINQNHKDWSNYWKGIRTGSLSFSLHNSHGKNVGSGWKRDYREKDWKITFHQMQVCFAGEAYLGYVALEKNERTYATNRVFLWTFDQFEKYIAKLGWFVDDKYRRYGSKKTNREELKEWYEQPTAPFVREWLLENRYTVTLYVEDGAQQDFLPNSTFEFDTDCLKHVEFVKRLDPVQAFQNISMWVGGVLPKPGPPMVKITDPKIKIAKHGMDKWSFRRMPEQK